MASVMGCFVRKHYICSCETAVSEMAISELPIQRKRDEVWMPGRDGITIPLVVPIEQGKARLTPYTEMIDVINKTAAELETMELLDEEHAVYIKKKEK